jgi:putative FmdB family regulatory protein
MPTYEFRCPKGHEFEKFYRSIGGAPSEVVCPTCGKKSERLMSAGGGLVFKGSGFYITDYGKDGKKPQTAPAAKAGEGASASGSASGESVSGSGGESASGSGGESAGAKGESKQGAEAKPSGDTKSSGDSKSATAPKPAAASKSAPKGSSRRAKSSE